MFIDESEEKEKVRGREYFSLTGLIVPFNNLINLENEISYLKSNYNIEDLKNIQRLDRTKNIKLTTEIVKILKKYECSVITALTVILDNSFIQKIKRVLQKNISTKEIKYLEMFKFLIERFSLFLEKKNSYGIMIIDRLPRKMDNSIVRGVYEKIKYDHYEEDYYHIRKKHFYEVLYPLLLQGTASLSNSLQCADLIGRSVRHAFRRKHQEVNIIKDPKEFVEDLYRYNEFLGLYWSLFQRNPKDNRIAGWGIKVWIL